MCMHACPCVHIHVCTRVYCRTKADRNLCEIIQNERLAEESLGSLFLADAFLAAN